MSRSRESRKYQQSLFGFFETNEEPARGVERLFAAIPDYGKSRRFARLLDACVRFRAYSPYNALLIHLQRPDAVRVLTPMQWRRQGRVVKPSARPLVILSPFAPVHFLYDVADTKDLPGWKGRSMAEGAADDETLPDVSPRQLLALGRNLPLWGIASTTVPTGPAATGEIHLAADGGEMLQLPVADDRTVVWPAVYSLSTREGASPTDAFTAIVHELARLFCRHLPCGYEKGWKAPRRLTEDAAAFEAQAVTALVCRRLGVASAAVDWMRDYLAAQDSIPAVSVDEILRATHEIEDMLTERTLPEGGLYRQTPSLRKELA